MVGTRNPLDGSESAYRLTLDVALFAKPINLEGVAGGEVVILLANFLLELSHFLREEFNRASALSAYHVVMATTVVLVLVARNAVVKCHFTGETAFG